MVRFWPVASLVLAAFAFGCAESPLNGDPVPPDPPDDQPDLEPDPEDEWCGPDTVMPCLDCLRRVGETWQDREGRWRQAYEVRDDPRCEASAEVERSDDPSGRQISCAYPDGDRWEIVIDDGELGGPSPDTASSALARYGAPTCQGCGLPLWPEEGDGLAQRAKAYTAYIEPGNDAARCSGILIDRDLVLTTGACVTAETCQRAEILFSAPGAPRRFRCAEVVESGLPYVDYALVRLSEIAGFPYEPIEFDLEAAPGREQRLALAHYSDVPRGGSAPTVVGGTGRLAERAPSSSGVAGLLHGIMVPRAVAVGAGVVDRDSHRLVGLHQESAVCDGPPATSLPIREVVAASPTLRVLLDSCPGHPNDDCDTTFAQLQGSGSYLCGLMPDGRVRCWGKNVPQTAPEGRFERIDGNCGIELGGRVISCWGRGRIEAPPGMRFEGVAKGHEVFGLLDDGRLVTEAGVVQVDGRDFRATALIGARGHTVLDDESFVCALEAQSEAIRCWGRAPRGPFDGRFIALGAYGGHNGVGGGKLCAIRAEQRSMSCWGGDFEALDGLFEQVAVGAKHVCGLEAGRVRCGGAGDPPDGQFDGDVAQYVVAGFFYTCILTRSGHVRCDNNKNGGPHPPSTEIFREVAGGLNVLCGLRVDGTAECSGWAVDRGESPPGIYVDVAAGQWHACTLDPEGQVECWFDMADVEVPVGRYQSIDAGRRATCGLREDGEIVCWGSFFGSAPLRAPANGPFRDLAVGEENVCGLREDGELECTGQARDGVTEPPAGPFVTVDIGDHHACALRPDGEVECWGRDSWGETDVPAELDGLSVQRLAASFDSTCALGDDGRVICWGYDANQTPAGLYRAINDARFSTCAAEIRGGIRCWGRDHER